MAVTYFHPGDVQEFPPPAGCMDEARQGHHGEHIYHAADKGARGVQEGGEGGDKGLGRGEGGASGYIWVRPRGVNDCH